MVTTVNGTPIFADKVLASLDRVFAAEAEQRDEQSFRAFATQEIQKQLNSFVGAELEVAAAMKNLDKQEQEIAAEANTRWRTQQITLAGGSLERARAKAAAEGYRFDELVKERGRQFLVQLYYQKKLFPRVQVSADDIRRYYNQHAKTEFTQQPEAHFRVIRIDARKTGGIDKARQKIDAIKERTDAGEDFAKLASTTNDDPGLMRAGGDVGNVPRGTFAIEPVETAVWKLQPGQVSSVIPVGDSFYLAKLESRKDGHVRRFEDEDVQREIEETLSKEQISARRQIQIHELERDAIISPDPPLIEPLVDMAMQRCAQWASAR